MTSVAKADVGPSHSTRVAWVALAVVGGGALALQSRVNGELSERIDDGIFAAFVSFSVGLVLVATLSIVTPHGRRGVQRLVTAIRTRSMPWCYALTGVFGAAVVASQGLAVPALGVALYTVGIVAGQSLSGMLVDRIGIGVLTAKPITPRRVLGALLAVAAVAVGLAGTGLAPTALALIVLPVVAGLCISLQQAFAGQVQHHTKSALTQTTSNFLLGTAVLAVVVAIRALLGHGPSALPTEPLLYVGGLLGCVFVALASVAVHHIGVLLLTVTSIAGQVVMALVLDLSAPTAGHQVGAASFIGAALSIAAVVVAAVPVRRLAARA